MVNADLNKDIATETATKGGAGSVIVGTGALLAGVPWHLIAIGAAVIILGVAAYFVYKNRDLFARKANGG